MMSRLPDFIIVGAMKCATTTLHRQLQCQPGIFMTDKTDEPSFFSNDEAYARGIEWYESLFAGAQASAISGESSTAYTKLPTYRRTVKRMRAALPHVRLIYIMRHPIDRLVSHYIHEWTQGVLSLPIDRAVDEFPELIHYSRYAMQLRPYLATYPAEQILPVFSERLRARPQQELARVCRFLGYPRRPKWHEEVGSQNVSAERLRRCRWRDAVVNQRILARLRRALVPKSTREAVKKLWTIRKRPMLAPEQAERLAGIFDEDLAELGSWLGINLNCANFAQRVLAGRLRWTEAAHSIHAASVAGGAGLGVGHE